MHITFGLLLDGEHGWRPASRLGRPILGPLGLLNLLETWLGLVACGIHAGAASDAVSPGSQAPRPLPAGFGVLAKVQWAYYKRHL